VSLLCYRFGPSLKALACLNGCSGGAALRLCRSKHQYGGGLAGGCRCGDVKTIALGNVEARPGAPRALDPPDPAVTPAVLLEDVDGAVAAPQGEAPPLCSDEGMVGIPAHGQRRRDGASVRREHGEARRAAIDHEDPLAALIDRHGEIRAEAGDAPARGEPTARSVDDADFAKARQVDED